VEDERIVAEDLRDMLKSLKYEVVGIVSSGEDAIQMAEETRPDLVLMDIQLNGQLDGVQAAEAIWAHQGIPVTYLTAFADENTLERAKATLPFGYILKPFEERDLKTTIEIALYKQRMDSTLSAMNNWHASAIDSISDGIIATNPKGGITFMNPAAEAITGWTLREAFGKKFNDTFKVSTSGILKTRDGRDVHVDHRVSTLRNEAGDSTGNIVLLREANRATTNHV